MGISSSVGQLYDPVDMAEITSATTGWEISVDEMQQIGQHIYQQPGAEGADAAAGAGPAPGAAEGGEAPAAEAAEDDEEVIDADFEMVDDDKK